MSSNEFRGPLFVTGLWRSGTSLLYALLNQHPQIAIMYEAELPMLKPLFWMGQSREDWLQRWNCWNGALTRHQISFQQFSTRMPSLAAATEAVYKSYSTEKQASIWGCKTVSAYDSLVRLHRIFPGARFIVIWRDLEAICSSIARAAAEPTWFARKGMAHRALLGNKALKLECDRLVCRKVPLHQLCYEELVRNPAAEISRICAFLAVDFHPKMASLTGADRSAVGPGKHHELVKSGNIESSTERPNALSRQFRAKIQRYVRLWRHQYNETWPLYSVCTHGNDKPGMFERLGDAVVYRLLRMFDALTLLGYCFAPLSSLNKHRARKWKGNIFSATPETDSVAKSPLIRTRR